MGRGMERECGDFKMTSGHKGREYEWGIFFKIAFFWPFSGICSSTVPRCQLEKMGRVGQEVLIVSYRVVGRPCLFQVIVIIHS